jgi:hypothetical protein
MRCSRGRGQQALFDTIRRWHSLWRCVAPAPCRRRRPCARPPVLSTVQVSAADRSRPKTPTWRWVGRTRSLKETLACSNPLPPTTPA